MVNLHSSIYEWNTEIQEVHYLKKTVQMFSKEVTSVQFSDEFTSVQLILCDTFILVNKNKFAL